MGPQLGVVKMEEVTQEEGYALRAQTAEQSLGVLLDFLRKVQWAKTMVEVNLAAATAVELLSHIGPQP